MLASLVPANKGLKWIQLMDLKLSSKKHLNSVFGDFPYDDHLIKNKALL